MERATNEVADDIRRTAVALGCAIASYPYNTTPPAYQPTAGVFPLLISKSQI